MTLREDNGDFLVDCTAEAIKEIPNTTFRIRWYSTRPFSSELTLEIDQTMNFCRLNSTLSINFIIKMILQVFLNSLTSIKCPAKPVIKNLKKFHNKFLILIFLEGCYVKSH